MLLQIINTFFYGIVIFSLFLIDYVLGNGFVDMLSTAFCKIVCFVRKTIKEEAQQTQITGPDNEFNVYVLLTEIIVLSLTITFLKRYKLFRGKDRIDELLNESKDILRQTNLFLEKWRLRRMPSEFSYLDEEPQEIKPLKLEVPILHMAIIDTLGKTKNQPESGDVGDPVNITDATFLSVTSMLDDDLDTYPEHAGDEKIGNETKNTDFKNRYLWDVIEEETSDLVD